MPIPKGQFLGVVSGLSFCVVLTMRWKQVTLSTPIILSTAINNDGASKANYLAPSAAGQALVIDEALQLADIDADTITYVETHGTGTRLGDPIEIQGLTQAFRQTTDKTGYCAIGSTKPNIGHLDTAAGVASFIKAVQALKHHQLPAQPQLPASQPDDRFRQLTIFRQYGIARLAGRFRFSAVGLGSVHSVSAAPTPMSSSKSRPNFSPALLLTNATTSCLFLPSANDRSKPTPTNSPTGSKPIHQPIWPMWRIHCRWAAVPSANGVSLSGKNRAALIRALRELGRSESATQVALSDTPDIVFSFPRWRGTIP